MKRSLLFGISLLALASSAMAEEKERRVIAAIGKTSSPCLEISRCRTPTNRHFAQRIFERNQTDIDPR